MLDTRYWLLDDGCSMIAKGECVGWQSYRDLDIYKMAHKLGCFWQQLVAAGFMPAAGAPHKGYGYSVWKFLYVK